MNIDHAVRIFADCVVKQREAIARGDSRRGNQASKKYIDAFNKIRSHGSAGKDALAGLLDDARPEVRVMAATFLLKHCENRARAVLEKDAAGTGPTAFGAAQALKRWAEGSWTLDTN
jgi:hypothetical protein